jgi:acetyltransferase-like isoleucine patch superfamily enzyme
VNHNYQGDLLPYDRNDVVNGIKIGRYVWLGMNVCVLPGVRIGDGAIVGMGTVVSRDVGPGEILVSASTRVVGHRNEAHTESLLVKSAFLETH